MNDKKLINSPFLNRDSNVTMATRGENDVNYVNFEREA
ncbi:hypothetical protein JCM19237_5310 [Photobacterium aphoticum]|uniref:Uncharacterized protein n=1 Tax=Photobacterium aphoticum TaxID=754436 RepID=A0A090R464_9GAMM|nr:hypothetical protein JCM19237_5310 [Photobacterium aphoticum]